MNEALDRKHAWDGNQHLIGNTPEMETNHVKTTDRPRLWGTSEESFHLPALSFVAIWCGARNDRKQGRKGSPRKGNIMEQERLIPCPMLAKSSGAQRLGGRTMLNVELTKLLHCLESDAFWDRWAGGKQSPRICWEVLIIWKTWQNSYDLWGKVIGAWSVPMSQALEGW